MGDTIAPLFINCPIKDHRLRCLSNDITLRTAQRNLRFAVWCTGRACAVTSLYNNTVGLSLWRQITIRIAAAIRLITCENMQNVLCFLQDDNDVLSRSGYRCITPAMFILDVGQTTWLTSKPNNTVTLRYVCLQQKREHTVTLRHVCFQQCEPNDTVTQRHVCLQHYTISMTSRAMILLLN